MISGFHVFGMMIVIPFLFILDLYITILGISMYVNMHVPYTVRRNKILR